VAVTATDEAGKVAIILANYSRKDSSRTKRRKGHYDFPRPDNPELELKIWEAAAATSAAPFFFKPFVHGPTKRTYLDGALYNNNPVKLVHRERKLLWPDVADRHPDILLSIGTGQNEDEIRKDMPGGPSTLRSSRRYVVSNSSGDLNTDCWTRRVQLERKEGPKTGWSPFLKLRQIFRTMVSYLHGTTLVVSYKRRANVIVV
jgi:patatin-like phospholipase/acyl hydrolase